uniref:Zinc ribbon domain-containing protein n=1 Tax=Gracilinema caldarium TaxID=215591 RepID=A0A7C3EC68_9SPIR
MPTYEYECKTCGHTFEAFQSMSDPVLKTCPECGKEVRRLINGGTGIIFKGSGFYVTDKGSSGKSSSKASSSTASCSSCASSDSGTCAAKTAV